MNYKQTPPIQWLPVFEAAAREQSFKRAAEELHVTPPAVGQQIKALESWLGVELFARQHRRLTLTAEGKFYLKIAQKVLHEHKQGYRQFRHTFHNTSFNVSASLIVAQELLIPNYLSFVQYYPDSELRIEARMSLADFASENIDASIRFGAGDWSGTKAMKLVDATAAPVCSAEYFHNNPFSSLEDLKQHRLIFSSAELEDWRFLIGDDHQPKLVCDSYMASLKAASEGLGVAMGLFPVSNSWVNQKKLILPLQQLVPIPYSYWVCIPDGNTHPACEAFYQWSKALFDNIEPLKNDR